MSDIYLLLVGLVPLRLIVEEAVDFHRYIASHLSSHESLGEWQEGSLVYE